MKIKQLASILLFLFLHSSCGTLGGFDIRTFPTSKKVLVRSIDTLFARHPEYIIPEKWKNIDTGFAIGYNFLDSRFFYFNATPEEMYYVSFIGDANGSIQKDTTATRISIRAVNDGTSGWKLEKKFNSSERERIEKRFDKEIIYKIEEYTKCVAIREK